MRRTRILKMVSIGLIGISAVSALVMVLWNALVPQIFPVRAINFWQALGLLILCKLLFGGIRVPFGPNQRWRERWERMTPEQRMKFKKGLRGGCFRAREHEPMQPDAEVRT